MLAVVGILALIAVRRIRTGSFPPGIPLLFFLHAVDLLGWRTQILREATVPLSPAQRAVLDVRPIPYAARRTPTDEGHPRAMTFGRELLPPNSRSAGTVYDYSDAFLHRDASWSIYFVTQWSPSIDLLLRARAGRSLSFNGDPPPTFVSGEPPRTRPEGIARVIGESEDKLQVYSTAHAARTDEEIAAVLGRADFQGGTLLLSADPGEPAAPLDPALATGNERLPGTPQVLEYRADRIRIEVDVPQGRSGAWLAYADCWHPGWRATVDGVPQAVRRANLAYKAVPLHAGRNVVEFRLHAPLRAACYGLVGLQCLGWTLGLIAGALHYLGILRPRTAARLP
jgi:hypothetical protein